MTHAPSVRRKGSLFPDALQKQVSVCVTAKAQSCYAELAMILLLQPTWTTSRRRSGLNIRRPLPPCNAQNVDSRTPSWSLPVLTTRVASALSANMSGWHVSNN